MAEDSIHSVEPIGPVPAPPEQGGAGDAIVFVDAPRAWATDGEGYPPEAGLGGDEPEEDTDPESTDESVLVADVVKPTLEAMGPHLDELRRRLVTCLAVFAPLFGVGLWLYQPLWNLVTRPLDRAAPHLLRFQALGPSDGLVMAMRLAFAFALFLSLPIWLAEFWGFVAPGLARRERRWLYLGLGFGGVLFAIGAAIAYFAGIPFALEYLLPFNQSLKGWENAFTGYGYVDFVVTCCAGFGLAFELPLVMLILGWIGILTPEGLREWWRPAVLIIFVLAAVMTPPDPFTQTMLALPMLGLFWLGYWLVKWVAKTR